MSLYTPYSSRYVRSAGREIHYTGGVRSMSAPYWPGTVWRAPALNVPDQLDCVAAFIDAAH